jgi:hypothetical protein
MLLASIKSDATALCDGFLTLVVSKMLEFLSQARFGDVYSTLLDCLEHFMIGTVGV